MRRWLGLALLVVLFARSSAVPPSGEEAARVVAEAFGRALTSGHANELRGVLPAYGKVHLVLLRLGPEEGFYGASQVEALFRDFLDSGSVGSFVVVRLESDGRSSTLVHARAQITDREGRPAKVSLHLALQPEESRWVVREVKETAE